MRASPSRRVGLVIALIVIAQTVLAQDVENSLAGVVTSSTGSPIVAANISAKNLNSGISKQAQTDSSGRFHVDDLESGDYEISITADGFVRQTRPLKLPATGLQGVSFSLTPSNATGAGLPNAPSASQSGPSLSDLGFPPEETQSNAKQQALLDKRTHMLKIHQKLGLITAAPLVATLVASVGAGGHNTSSTDRTVHMVLGAVTSDLYFTSAYFAIRAPRVPGTTTRGPIRLHKALAWVHGPGMILTPILGALAYDQKNNGEKVHGIASAHGPVAIVTAGAFGAALLSVSLKF